MRRGELPACRQAGILAGSTI